MSLLKKALQNTSTARQTITPDHIELANAFIASKIGITAVNVALGHPKTSIQGYITVCRALRQQHQTNNKPTPTEPTPTEPTPTEPTTPNFSDTPTTNQTATLPPADQNEIKKLLQ